MVSFQEKKIIISTNSKPELTIYDGEQTMLSLLLKSKKEVDLIAFYNWKKNNKLSQKQFDSLLLTMSSLAQMPLIPSKGQPLLGKRIAIDPGHFAGNLKEARVEQKFIEFIPNDLSSIKDTIRFNEGALTFQTAIILKEQLEQLGAQVFVSRTQQNYTSFNVTYQHWFDSKRKRTLDSLLSIKNIDLSKYKALIKQTKEKLFWSFFRDYELAQRAKLINEFKPDATVIIHYNVDEKNTDWLKPTTKNFTMTFIGGGMTADNFNKTISKIHFLRLLLSNQLQQSEQLSAHTVNEFHKQLHIPIASKNDADYLKENCLKTSSSGVFCRNLALCRTINSPLVYGEALYQDNISECQALNSANYNYNGLIIPQRVFDVAQCYLSALKTFFEH